MPCNNVLSVTQTTDGYLWLGTEEGLVRFDGMHAHFFERQTEALPGARNISQVIEDVHCPGCLLFLGSSGNLHRFKAGVIQPGSLNTASIHQPGQILVQNPSDGAFWVGTAHGLFRVGSKGEITAPSIASPEWPAEPINSLCRDNIGRLWIGSGRGIYRQIDAGDGRRFQRLTDWQGGEVDCLAPARGGGMWIAARQTGVGRLDENQVFHPCAALEGCAVTSLLEDRHGMLWAGTFGSGLYRLPISQSAKDAKPHALTTINGLVDNQINSLCEDREGNLWMATQKGLQVLRDTRFENYGTPEGVASDDVITVFEDQQGQLWFGTKYGISHLNAARDQVMNYATPTSPKRPGDGIVLCLGQGDDVDTLLVGTHTGLLQCRDRELQPLTLRDDLDGSTVRALCIDTTGERWIGTSSGLYQMRAGQILARLTAMDGLADNVVRALYADNKRNLWIATDGGLSRRSANGKITNYLTNNVGSVVSIAKEPSGAGDLFVGTESGLYRLHTSADGAVKVTTYTTREGLYDNTIWSLLDDSHGYVWMSSNKGISRVAWSDLDQFDRGKISMIRHVTYDVQDGLRSREGNGGHQPVACRDHSGALWFAMVKGAARIDPADATASNSVPPPVRIEEFIVDGVVAPILDGPLAALPPNTQKFEFRYTSLSLTAPERNWFRYRLEPFDAQWTDAGPERVAHYTNLPPGQYRFRVRAANGDGVWNETGATLEFTLKPHLYQIVWVWWLGAFVALGLGWVWLRRHKENLVARVVRAESDVRERIRIQEILYASKEEAEHARVEAEHARAEAERASSAKSDFLSRVSHELRTPLNAILGFGQLLEVEDLTPGQSRSVGHILHGGRHLLALVNEVLDLASIESGKLGLDLEDVEIGPLLRESVDLVGPMARANGVKVHLDTEFAQGRMVVRADRRRFKQVLLNLLDNAVKYNRPNNGEIFMNVSVESDADAKTRPEEWLQVRVRDTGAGIEEPSLRRLFTPFERLGAAYGPIKGTGLGLAVSKQLMAGMGGALDVESVVGEGTIFSVSLPLGARMTTPNTNIPPTEKRDASLAASASSAAVLYIEDNPSNLEVVESLLARERPQWQFVSAVDSSSGLERARRSPPDLILLDLQLPGMSGEEILAELRMDAVTRHIPIIILSADATRHSRQRLLAKGADDFLTKPLDLEHFLETADRILREAATSVQVG